MKKTLSFLFLALFTMTLTACGAPSPEELCKKAEEKDQKECTAGLEEIKKLIGDDLWKDFSKCAKDKDFKKKEEVMACMNADMTKKIEEKMKADMEKAMKEAAPK
jgi:predicted small lipoprotein YifL